jgi:hypothetical protein
LHADVTRPNGCGKLAESLQMKINNLKLLITPTATEGNITSKKFPPTDETSIEHTGLLAFPLQKNDVATS